MPTAIEALSAFTPAPGPGRLNIDEHSLDPFPGSKVSARASGEVIHHQDGCVEPEPYPWPE